MKKTPQKIYQEACKKYSEQALRVNKVKSELRKQEELLDKMYADLLSKHNKLF